MEYLLMESGIFIEYFFKKKKNPPPKTNSCFLSWSGYSAVRDTG